MNACKKATGVDIKVDYLPRRPGDYAEVYSDPSKINRELNWTAQYTDLEKSLQVAWKWQKAHRNGYGISSAIWVSSHSAKQLAINCSFTWCSGFFFSFSFWSSLGSLVVDSLYLHVYSTYNESIIINNIMPSLWLV